MIPRTKVNYTFAQLLRALWVRERGRDHRGRLTAELGAYLGLPHVLLTASGRGAMYAILRAVDLPKVVIPAYTCKAVAEAAILAGKELVYAPMEPGSFNIAAEALAKVVDRQSVVIATHQFGIPCAIERIVEVCRARGALVVEDVAAALGTRVAGRLTGTFGDVAFFSFDSTKLVNAPMKGGAVATVDPELFARIARGHRAEVRPMPVAHKLRLLALAAALLAIENHVLYRLFWWAAFGRTDRFTTDGPELHPVLDAFYRYEFANWQASIVAPQIGRLPALVERRRRLYSQLRGELASCARFTLPPADERAEWACIRFPILVRGDKLHYYRTAARRGVDFAFSFTFVASREADPRANALADAVLDVPFYDKLSERERRRVVHVLRSLEGPR